MPTKDGLLHAAKEYAKLGWRVFPIHAITANGECECGNAECDKAGKHPAILKWPTAATADIAQIVEWWSGNPNRGIGIATGKDSGITVLDVDGEEGVESLGKLAEGNGIPPTPTVQSRPGRYHYYFNFDATVKSNSGKLGTKLDTRGNGGYVVAPPSRHVAGGLYTWLQHPSAMPLADWPDFLKEKASAKRGRPAKETFNPANPADVEQLVSALEHIDPDEEERWAQVGWIMGRAFHQSDSGFAYYSAWSARSRKYDAKRTKAHYYERSKEVRGSDLRTTGSLFQWAEEGGFVRVNPSETEERPFNIYESPFRERTMVHDFISASAAAPHIFVMDKRLIRIVRYGASGHTETGIDRDPTAFIVWPHDADTLSVELGDIAAYWAYKGNRFVRTGFARRSVQTFINCKEYHHDQTSIKPLDAFVSHPTLRGDGTLLTDVGYDPTSRLFLTQDVVGLRVNTKLSAKEAKSAMTQLLAPFSEYPWADKANRAVFVAALFTVGLRHLFETAPLFAFSSPKHGSGKTQLAECISRLWYGITLSKATWTPNPEEMEKRIASFLLAGDRMVCLDNVTEGVRLEDSTLNKVLTSRRNTFRILGRTERVELSNEATWFATGNQLMLSGDISRRALLCYIDAKVVDPGARSFTIQNLPAHIMRNRPVLMSAALSIAASWMALGRPNATNAPREFGSFNDWYSVIRPMILWAGEADIAQNIDNLTDEDTENVTLESFANALRTSFPPDSSRLPLAEVLKLFSKDTSLRSAFAGCMPSDREPNFRTLSELLRRCENKIFISDNPGHEFTVNKRKDSNRNIFLWGVEYLKK